MECCTTYIHEILIFIGLFIFQATPHGSLENVSVVSPTQDRLSLEAMVAKASNVASNLISFEKQPQNLRRSTSMSTPQHHPTPPNVSDMPPPPQQVSITYISMIYYLIFCLPPFLLIKKEISSFRWIENNF